MHSATVMLSRVLLRSPLFPAATSVAKPSALRLCYSSASSSSSSSSARRLLQTSTHHSPSTFSPEPPLPRGAGVRSSLTNPTAESAPQTAAPPPPSPSPSQQFIAEQATPTASSSVTATESSSRTTTAASPAPTQTKFRPRKAAMALSQTAVRQLKRLMDQPTPQLIRVGVKNRGCSGLAYHLEYVDKPGRFDDEVVQDGVRVLIDSKALFSIIGSEMDWVEDKLSARFVFKNPNISELPPSPLC